MPVDHTRTISVTPTGSNYTVVSSDTSWCNVTLTTDNNGVADVWTITVDENTNLISRTATITATHSNSNTDTIDVIQGAANDTTAPTITLLGNSPETFTEGTQYTDAGATANDPEDGDITANITTTITDSNGNAATLNTSTPAGTYTITYNVADSSNNAATPVTRMVIVAAQTYTVDWQPTHNLTNAHISLTDGGPVWPGSPAQQSSVASGSQASKTFYIVPSSGYEFVSTADISFANQGAVVSDNLTGNGSIQIDLQLNNITQNTIWNPQISGASYDTPEAGPMAFKSTGSSGLYSGGQPVNGIRNYTWDNSLSSETDNQTLCFDYLDAGNIDISYSTSESNILPGQIYLSLSSDGSTNDTSQIVTSNEWIHNVSQSDASGTDNNGNFTSTFKFDEGAPGSSTTGTGNTFTPTPTGN